MLATKPAMFCANFNLKNGKDKLHTLLFFQVDGNMTCNRMDETQRDASSLIYWNEAIAHAQMQKKNP